MLIYIYKKYNNKKISIFEEILISKNINEINSIFYEPKVPSIDSSSMVNKEIAEELLQSAKFTKNSNISLFFSYCFYKYTNKITNKIHIFFY